MQKIFEPMSDQDKHHSGEYALKYQFEIPMASIVSEANNTDHWTKKA